MAEDQSTCIHREVAVTDGATGVTEVECAACRRRYVSSPDTPTANYAAGVAALAGGNAGDWQYIGLWKDCRIGSLNGLDHYQRRPKAAVARQ